MHNYEKKLAELSENFMDAIRKFDEDTAAYELGSSDRNSCFIEERSNEEIVKVAC